MDSTQHGLTDDDLALLIESLHYARLKFEATEYPSYQMRQSQLARVDTLSSKLRALLSRGGAHRVQNFD